MSASNSSSGNSNEAIDGFLNSCNSLPSWIKEEIRKAYETGLKETGWLALDVNELFNGYYSISANMIPDIIKCIKIFGSTVKALSLDNNNLQKAAIKLLFNKLRENNIKLFGISLKGSAVGSKCMDELGEYIRFNDKLRYINLEDCGVSGKALQILYPYLIGNRVLKHFCLDSNLSINDESVSIIKKILLDSSIEKIDLRRTKIDNSTQYELSVFMISVAHARAGNDEVAKCIINEEFVDIDNEFDSFIYGSKILPEWVKQRLKDGKENGFGMIGWLDLSKKKFDEEEQLINDSMLREILYAISLIEDSFYKLDLSWNNLSSDGATLLFGSLHANISQITVIDLTGNPIDIECKNALDDYILQNSYIKQILLQETLIPPNRVLRFEEWLEEILDSRGPYNLFSFYSPPQRFKVKLPYPVVKILQNGLISGFEGGLLDLTGKNINDLMIPELCNWLLVLRSKVKIIKLGRNGITTIGGDRLFLKLIDSEIYLRDIHLEENKLDDDCLKSLLRLIKWKYDLSNVYISGNRITDKGIEILPEFLTENMSLSHFDLSNNKGITNDSYEILLRIAASSNLENLQISNTSISYQNQRNMAEFLKIPPENRMENIGKYLQPISIFLKSISPTSNPKTITPFEQKLQQARTELQMISSTYLKNYIVHEEDDSEVQKPHYISKHEMLQMLFFTQEAEGTPISKKLQSTFEESLYPGLVSFFELKNAILKNANFLKVSSKLEYFDKLITQVEKLVELGSIKSIEELENEFLTFCERMERHETCFNKNLNHLNDHDKKRELATKEASRLEIIKNFEPNLSLIDIWRSDIQPRVKSYEWSNIDHVDFEFKKMKEIFSSLETEEDYSSNTKGISAINSGVASLNLMKGSGTGKNELIDKAISSVETTENAIQQMNESIAKLNECFVEKILTLENTYLNLQRRKYEIEYKTTKMMAMLGDNLPKISTYEKIQIQGNFLVELDKHIEMKDQKIDELVLASLDIQTDIAKRKKTLSQSERESLEHKMRDLEENIKLMRWEHEDLVEEFNKQCFDEITDECLFPDLVKQVDETNSSNREVIRIPNVLKIKSNRCELLEKIGGGGFSSVYKMKMKRKNKEGDDILSFKQISISAAVMTKDEINMAEKEIELLSQLEHENIVKIVGAIGDPTASDNKNKKMGIGIVMEYCENGSLREFLSKIKYLDHKRLINILMDVACGLEYLHTHEPTAIIHGDIKSDNILIDKKFNAKLCDFGISKLMQTTQASSTRVGGGTLPYRALEVFDGKMELKSDIYSFGCVILEMLTGERPWNGLGEAEITKNVTVERKQHDISKIKKETNNRFPELIMLMKKCLDYDKDKRPTINNVKDDLQICRETMVQNEIDGAMPHYLISAANYNESRFGIDYTTFKTRVKEKIKELAVEYSRKHKDWINQLILHAKRERTLIEQQGTKLKNWQMYCHHTAYCAIIHTSFDFLSKYSSFENQFDDNNNDEDGNQSDGDDDYEVEEGFGFL